MQHLTRQRLFPLTLIASAVFVLDQLSKYYFLVPFDLPIRAPVHVNDYFTLVMAWNRGVSFSMFSRMGEWMPIILTLAAVVISALLVRLTLKSPHPLERLGYAMVVGGALGNAFDRVRFGAVADFFYLHVGALGWPAFNVADMAIVSGVGLLLLTLMCTPRDQQK